MTTLNKIKILLCIGLICFCHLSFSSSKGSKEKAQLTKIIDEIKTTKKVLQQHQTQQANLQLELKKTELKSGECSVKIKTISKKLSNQQQSIQTLLTTKKTVENEVLQQQTLLAQQIKIGYLLSHNKNYFKIFLNQEDPTCMERMLMYCRYLNQERCKNIQKLTKNIVTLKQNKIMLEHKKQELDTIQHQQLKVQEELLTQQKQRQLLLKSIENKVQTSNQKLATLLVNKKTLENTLKRLEKIKVTTVFLKDHKGKYPWPTHGKIIEAYGTPIGKSELKQTGVLIAAPKGQAVQAVAPGRVVFANWLPGYGLLLIIAHGQDYMSLYGNNTTLHKKVNDVVKSGDLIAQVGDSGGRKTPALFFSVRHHGKAINPQLWCG